MFYIVGVFHLSQYLGEEYYLNNNVYGNNLMCSCLGTFSLISGYLIGLKYTANSAKEILYFYKKRVIRFYPLFLLSAILLYIIGFNDFNQTLNALLGLSPFLIPRPYTLWYISMIMTFYLITPIVLRKNKSIMSLVIIMAIVILSRFIKLDGRYIFNLFLYLIGLNIGHLQRTNIIKINRKVLLKNVFTKILLISILCIYIIMLIILQEYNRGLFRIITNITGTFILVLGVVCLPNQLLNRRRTIINFLAYTSMSCYLFHRFVYYIILSIYQPKITIILMLYLFFIALPLCFVFSYYIQTLYDKGVKIKS